MMQQKNLMRINGLGNRSQHHQGQSQRHRSQYTTSAIDPSNFSQHHNGHSQQSGQPSQHHQSQRQRHRSQYTTSAIDPSHLSQHHNGHSHRSTQSHPAPQESEPTAEPENKQKAVSIRANARITCIIRRKRWDRANHERQSTLEQNEKV